MLRVEYCGQNYVRSLSQIVDNMEIVDGRPERTFFQINTTIIWTGSIDQKMSTIWSALSTSSWHFYTMLIISNSIFLFQSTNQSEGKSKGVGFARMHLKEQVPNLIEEKMLIILQHKKKLTPKLLSVKKLSKNSTGNH